MDYSKLLVAYNNNDVEYLKKYKNSSELKEMPIMGASGMFEENKEVFIDICKWMFQNGLDVNAVEGNGNTGLMVACIKNNYDFVKLYIDNNADINKKCQYDHTAIFAALSNNDEKIIKLLVEFGADLNLIIENEYGLFSTLEQACYNCSIEILEYLLKKGASPVIQKSVIDTIEWDEVENFEDKKELLKKYSKKDKKNSNSSSSIQKTNQRSKEFLKLEEKIKKLNEDEILEHATEIHDLIAELDMFDNTTRFNILILGIKLGISSKNGQINAKEKLIVQDILAYAWLGDITELYEIVSSPVIEDDYELIYSIAKLGNDLLLYFYEYILCFAYIDGKVDDEDLNKLDEILKNSKGMDNDLQKLLANVNDLYDKFSDKG